MSKVNDDLPPCIVLAGGHGTRLRSLIPNLPKCLAPVGEKSFVEIQIDVLRRAGFRQFIFSLGYMADKVIDAVSKFQNADQIRYAVESKPLGTGGALAFIMDHFNLSSAVVANGDSLIIGDLGPILAPLNSEAGELVRIACVEVDDVGRYGMIQLDAKNRAVAFDEKIAAGRGVINGGLYHINNTIFDDVGSEEFSLETEIFPKLVREKHVFGSRITGEFVDIGIPEAYYSFCKKYEK
jgi:D-glycero-alpha-D-manno-heptose 1-phosphate guanylyltransferase